MSIKYIALLFILSITQQAKAWNDCGHMAIAAIAYAQLNDKAQLKVAELLKRNPDYSSWVGGEDASNRERTAFMKAATWPDSIKNNPRYTNQSESSETGAKAIAGYRDLSQHRSWHYINRAFSPDGTALHAADTPNIETQINALRDTLQSSSASIDARSYSLVWLIHLVGDAHQPLHSSSRYTHYFPQGDKGGNAVIICARRCDTNLHAYWDELLGNTRKPQSVMRLAARLPAADRQRAAALDTQIWLNESMRLSQQVAYASPIGADAEPVVLNETYQTNARNAARQQAALAGARLANLLNQLLR